MKKWQKEHEEFLKDNPVTQYRLKNLYIAFCLFFPDFKTTYNGFKNKRCELRVVTRNCNSTLRSKPLMAEQVKKGMVRVKVAECVWVQKQRYLWESHYGVRCPKSWCFYFLDGNNRNFKINNIYPMSRELQGLFLGHTSGVVKGNRQATLLNIQIAMTMHSIFNFARKYNLVGASGSLKSVVAERARINKRKRFEKLSSEQQKEVKEKNRQRSKERYERLKNNPEKYAEYLEKSKLYKREWKKRKREEKNESRIESRIER